MRPRRWFIVLNPVADRGRAKRAWRRACRVMEASGVTCDVARTDGTGHAALLAEQAAGSDYDAVIAAGGDGTVQEVAAGLLRVAGGEATLPMGVLPFGSGNDFAKYLAPRCRNPEAATHALLEAEHHPVDVGRLGDRYFTNGVGVGLDARVGIETRRIRRLRGTAAYAWALGRVLRTHNTPRMRVEIDGRVVADGPLTLVTIANGGCHGGGFWLCPDARIDDGLLDVCVADAFSRRALLPFIPRVMRGTHVGRTGVTMHRGRRIRITGPEPLPTHADGEVVVESRELNIELLPGRLTVLRAPGPAPRR